MDLLTADGEYLYTAAAVNCMIVILHYKTKLTASEEEQQELLRVLSMG